MNGNGKPTKPTRPRVITIGLGYIATAGAVVAYLIYLAVHGMIR